MMKLALASAAVSSCSGMKMSLSANPVRKVVTMLQMMEKKVQAEGETEQKLFDKFMCYCKNGKGDLEKSVAEAEEKSGSLPETIEQGEAEVSQLKSDSVQAQTERAAAKATIAEATGIRHKEAAEFAKESTDFETNIEAMKKAVAALRNSEVAAFLQSGSAEVLKNLVTNDEKMMQVDREDLTAFLVGGEGHPQTDEIIGILQQMLDTAIATLKDISETEKKAISDYDILVKAKKKEIDTLSASLEEHMQRIGDKSLQLATWKMSLTDVEEALTDDKKLLKELEANCATRADEWEVACKTRAEEQLALADTIKVLNDDDALELFKKTLPGASSFLQIQVTQASMRATAASGLMELRTSRKSHRERINFILMAIQGKKIATDKIFKMIDNMRSLLQNQQVDDNNKREYCTAQLDFTDDRLKETVRKEGKLSAAISDAKEEVADLTQDIEALTEGIAALDKMVPEATGNRKEENSDYTSKMASDSAAKQILKFAQNRLNKFYNPKMYKAPEQEGGTSASFLQVAENDISAYSKRAEENAGVMSMINTLLADIDREMTESKVNEEQAQEEYEELMADSAEKHRLDSASVVEKEAVRGDLAKKLTQVKDEKKTTVKEMMATEMYLSQLHAECDWLIKNFDIRKEARATEIAALGKAKAVLSGAADDLSFVQMTSATFLQRMP